MGRSPPLPLRELGRPAQANRSPDWRDFKTGPERWPDSSRSPQPSVSLPNLSHSQKHRSARFTVAGQWRSFTALPKHSQAVAVVGTQTDQHIAGCKKGLPSVYGNSACIRLPGGHCPPADRRPESRASFHLPNQRRRPIFRTYTRHTSMGTSSRGCVSARGDLF